MKRQKTNLDEGIRKHILLFQRNEITEHFVYLKLSEREKGENKKILKKIASDELRHYNEWKKHTQTDVNPNKFLIWFYVMLSKLFGITFALKIMEKGEAKVQQKYAEIEKIIPETKSLIKDEVEHEDKLLAMIDEERINYLGSIVLGLNDALVELTGALAGLTFALQTTYLVGIAGFITGVAASLSMAASEFLSQKSEGAKKPAKASTYTGIAYILTVIFLVFPYFVLSDVYAALGLTLFNAFLVILLFTFFASIVKDLEFKSTFVTMIIMSFGVAVISFIIGMLARILFNINV